MINHTLKEIYKQKVMRYYGFTDVNFTTLNEDEQNLLLYTYLSMQKGDNNNPVEQEIRSLGNNCNKTIDRECRIKDKVKVILRKRG